MNLIYIPTAPIYLAAPIYLTVLQKSRNLTTTTSSPSSNKGKGTSCIWMGQTVLLDIPAPGVMAKPNEHNVKTLSHLRVGDRIQAEGLMTVQCGIRDDRRGRPEASMWLSFKIQYDWTFLGNPGEDNEDDSDEGDEEDDDEDEDDGSDDGDSVTDKFNQSKAGTSKDHSSNGGTKKDHPITATEGYSGPVTRAKNDREAKTGDKRLPSDDKSDRTDVVRKVKGNKGGKKPQSESDPVQYSKRVRKRTVVGPAGRLSVRFSSDTFDYLAKDEESQRKKGGMDVDEGKIVAVSGTKGKPKDKDESDDSENSVDDNEDLCDEHDDENGDDEDDEDDTPPKQTKQAAKPTAAPVSLPSSMTVDTNATATVVTEGTKTTTTIKAETVLVTPASPTVNSVTAAAAMAMTNSVTTAMAIVRKRPE